MNITVKKTLRDTNVNLNYILQSETLPVSGEHVGELILKELQSAPDFIGQIDALTERVVTFKEMRERSVKCALWLRKNGYNSKTKMVVCTNNVMQAYVPFLAGLYNGMTVTVWDTKYCTDNIRLLYFMTKTYPEVIFIDNVNVMSFCTSILMLNMNSVIKPPPKIVVIEKPNKGENFGSFDSIVNDNVDANRIDRFTCIQLKSTMDTAVQMFSSNAVTYPGIVQIPYAAFTSPSNNNTPTMSRDEIGMWFGSLCWTHSLLLTVRCILSHVTAVKYPLFHETVMYQLIEKHKVNWVFLESSMSGLTELRDSVECYDVSSLKHILFGDTYIINEIRRHISSLLKNVIITDVYCTSETGVIAYTQSNNNRTEFCGYNVSNNVKLMIVDEETRRQVGSDVRGEIWCKTPCIAPSSVTECGSDAFDGWFYTGDNGYYDKNGNIYVLGKVDSVLVCKKHVFNLSEMENALKWRCKEITDVAILILPCEHDHDACPRAFVKRSPNSKVTKKLVNTMLHEISPYFPVIWIYFVKYVPYLPNGKIDRARISSNK